MAIEADLESILTEVFDPETGYSIMEMGLVDRAERVDGKIEVDFTLTYPGCPIGDEISQNIVSSIESATGTRDISVNVVWNPPWTEDRMSDALKLEFGFPV